MTRRVSGTPAWAKVAAMGAALATPAFAHTTVTVEVTTTSYLDYGACAGLCTQDVFANKFGEMQARPTVTDYVTLELPLCNEDRAPETREPNCPVCCGTVFHYQSTNVDFVTSTTTRHQQYPSVETIMPECDVCKGTVLICEPDEESRNQLAAQRQSDKDNKDKDDKKNKDDKEKDDKEKEKEKDDKKDKDDKDDKDKDDKKEKDDKEKDGHLQTYTIPGSRNGEPRTLFPAGTDGRPVPGASPIVVVGQGSGHNAATLTMPGGKPGDARVTYTPAHGGGPGVVILGNPPRQTHSGEDEEDERRLGSSKYEDEGKDGKDNKDKNHKDNKNDHDDHDNKEHDDDKHNKNKDHDDHDEHKGKDHEGHKEFGHEDHEDHKKFGHEDHEDHKKFGHEDHEDHKEFGHEGFKHEDEDKDHKKEDGHKGDKDGKFPKLPLLAIPKILGGLDGIATAAPVPPIVETLTITADGITTTITTTIPAAPIVETLTITTNGITTTITTTLPTVPTPTGDGGEPATCAVTEVERGLQQAVNFFRDTADVATVEVGLIRSADPLRTSVGLDGLGPSPLNERRALNLRGWLYVCEAGTYTLSTPGVNGAIFAWTGPTAFTSFNRGNARLLSVPGGILSRRQATYNDTEAEAAGLNINAQVLGVNLDVTAQPILGQAGLFSLPESATFTAEANTYIPIRIVCILLGPGQCLLRLTDPSGAYLFDNQGGSIAVNSRVAFVQEAPGSQMYPAFGNEGQTGVSNALNPFVRPANATGNGGLVGGGLGLGANLTDSNGDGIPDLGAGVGVGVDLNGDGIPDLVIGANVSVVTNGSVSAGVNLDLNGDGITDAVLTNVDNLINGVGGALGSVLGNATGAVSNITGGVISTIPQVTGNLGDLVTQITGALDGVVDGLGDTLAGVISGAGGALNNVTGTSVGDILGSVGDTLGTTLGGVGNIIGTAGEAVGGVLGANNGTSGLIDNLTIGVSSIGVAVETALDGAVSAATGILSDALGVVTNLPVLSIPTASGVPPVVSEVESLVDVAASLATVLIPSLGPVVTAAGGNLVPTVIPVATGVVNSEGNVVDTAGSIIGSIVPLVSSSILGIDPALPQFTSGGGLAVLSLGLQIGGDPATELSDLVGHTVTLGGITTRTVPTAAAPTVAGGTGGVVGPVVTGLVNSIPNIINPVPQPTATLPRLIPFGLYGGGRA